MPQGSIGVRFDFGFVIRQATMIDDDDLFSFMFLLCFYLLLVLVEITSLTTSTSPPISKALHGCYVGVSASSWKALL